MSEEIELLKKFTPSSKLNRDEILFEAGRRSAPTIAKWKIAACILAIGNLFFLSGWINTALNNSSKVSKEKSIIANSERSAEIGSSESASTETARSIEPGMILAQHAFYSKGQLPPIVPLQESPKSEKILTVHGFATWNESVR